MAKPFQEKVFVNYGQTYKAQTPTDLGVDYRPDPKADPIFPFTKADGKRYIFTPEFKAFFTPSKAEAARLKQYDLCPVVDLWICLGAKHNGERKDYDLFFSVNSAAQLADVASYYQLDNPSTPELDDIIDNDPHSIAFWNVGGRAVVPIGIKFIKGKPEILKLYTYPKDDGLWDIWMMGVSYYNNGAVHEAGTYKTKKVGGIREEGKNYNGVASDTTEVLATSTRVHGAAVEYVFHTKKSKDPLIRWVGEESYGPGVVGRTRFFETTGFVREKICSYTKAPDFSAHDLCPHVDMWLARSHYGTPSIWAELYFAVESVEMLNKVADFYGLPVPYDATIEAVLNTTPELYRIRTYELGHKGAHIPIVVASVIQENRHSVRLVLYTFLRPWEFDTSLELPEV